MNGNGGANQNWDLMSFIEAVTAELDRARDLSRVKSEAGRPLTYTVGNMSLVLNVFPVYDGDAVTFRTAGPNETGASELKVDLNSATATVVEQTTKPPPKVGDVAIDDIPLDKQTRDKLRNIGVDTKEDVERLRDVKVRAGSGEEFDFARLATLMDEAASPRRPQIHDVVSFHRPNGAPKLGLIGDNLDRISPENVALNNVPVETSIAPDYLELSVPEDEPDIGELRLRTVDGEELRVRLK
jgi:hypothetical protein